METVVGVFGSRGNAQRACEELRSNGFDPTRLSLMTPASTERDVHSVPASPTEQPGMGAAMGGAVGGALGMATASLVIPGVGPIIAIGLAAAAAGAAAGRALEHNLSEGLPADEVFFYEDALRRGRSVLVAFAEDGDQREAARAVMQTTGAETLDAAREHWWVGLRDAEEAAYDGGSFKADEVPFRRGFETALHPAWRGKSYDEAAGALRKQYPEASGHSFRRGFERGQAYLTRQQYKAQGGWIHG
jgi:hypothetical protein